MDRIRAGIRINGIVQGVGFRPFVHKLAEQHSLTGWIRNTPQGVEIEVEGRPSDVERFTGSISSVYLRLMVACSSSIFCNDSR